MLKPTLQTSRLLPVALVSLGLLLASPAGAASMTEPERCNWKADKVENRYSKCLSRSTTRLSNVLHGSTLAEDFHCAEQLHRSMDVIERRATFKDVGPECEARLTPESQACTQAAALIVAGRDLGDYGSQFDDLSLEDLACSPIQAYLQDSYDDGYDAGYGVGYGEGEASVDVTSDNRSVCEAANGRWADPADGPLRCESAGGTWANGSCTGAAPATCKPYYDCFLAGFCSQAAQIYDPATFGYENAYDGHTQTTQPALTWGCDRQQGSLAWGRGVSGSQQPDWALYITRLCGAGGPGYNNN